MAASSAGPLAPLRAVLDSFWICRVSIFSVLSGWLLLYAAPQAQALFFDLHTRCGRHAALGGLLPRGAPVLDAADPAQRPRHAARRAGPLRGGSHRWYGILIVHLPWMLALACLVGIGAGQLWAFAHIPDDFASPGMEFEKVAHDQLTLLLVTTICLTVLWVLAWLVLPLLINRLTARSGLLDVWLFRFIAAIMFGRRGVAPLTPGEASEGRQSGTLRAGAAPDRVGGHHAVPDLGPQHLPGLPVAARGQRVDRPRADDPDRRRRLGSRAHLLRLWRASLSPADPGRLRAGHDLARQCAAGTA